MSTIKTCRILGVNIAVTNMAQTVQYIENNLEELRGKYICVSNVHTTVMAHDNPAYGFTVSCRIQFDCLKDTLRQI